MKKLRLPLIALLIGLLSIGLWQVSEPNVVVTKSSSSKSRLKIPAQVIQRLPAAKKQNLIPKEVHPQVKAWNRAIEIHIEADKTRGTYKSDKDTAEKFENAASELRFLSMYDGLKEALAIKSFTDEIAETLVSYRYSKDVQEQQALKMKIFNLVIEAGVYEREYLADCDSENFQLPLLPDGTDYELYLESFNGGLSSFSPGSMDENDLESMLFTWSRDLGGKPGLILVINDSTRSMQVCDFPVAKYN